MEVAGKKRGKAFSREFLDGGWCLRWLPHRVVLMLLLIWCRKLNKRGPDSVASEPVAQELMVDPSLTVYSVLSGPDEAGL